MKTLKFDVSSKFLCFSIAECQCIKYTAPAIQDLVQKLIQSYSQAEEKCRDFMFPDLKYSLNGEVYLHTIM